MVTSMAVQAGHGYFRFETMRYVVGLFVVHGWFAVSLLRARRVHSDAWCRNKFLGMLVLIVLFLGVQSDEQRSVSNTCCIRSAFRGAPPSDMNGWGHFVRTDGDRRRVLVVADAAGRYRGAPVHAAR